jgi:hypothetical protein
MGYYTVYTLEIIEGDDYKTDHEEGIVNLTDYNYLFEESVKWYDHEEDMLKYSKMHPNVLFELIGNGEESGDQWKAYFKNGKMQSCPAIITFDEYDESKLK